MRVMPASYRIEGPAVVASARAHHGPLSPRCSRSSAATRRRPTSRPSASFGDGTAIQFHESATLYVGADPQTGAQIAMVRSVDTAGPPFMGMVIQVDLDTVTAPGQYACAKDGTGGAQIRVLVPGADALDTVEYMANATLDILELPDRRQRPLRRVVLRRWWWTTRARTSPSSRALSGAALT
ncbi:MAG: hypothetical protein MZV70_17205 [Desulfobacterales bacterium]|nr:hypothetical protein [Desulfobacterales bacterium]